MNTKLRKSFALVMAQALIASCLPFTALAASENESYTNEISFDMPLNPKIEILAQENLSVLASTELTGQESGFQSGNIQPFNSKLEAGSSPLAEADDTLEARPGSLQSGSLQEDKVAQAVLEVNDVLGADTAEMIEVEAKADSAFEEVLVVDNDVADESSQEVKWEEIQDEPGKTKISAGARFPIAIVSSLSSKTAKKGDPVEGRLKVDIKIGGRLIAQEGDSVIGHISTCAKARRMLHAEMSTKRWMRANGCIGVTFDEIITDSGEHLPLVAKPAFVRRVVENKNEGRVLGVNHNGELASPLSTQLKHQAAHLVIRGAASAGGVFSMGIVPAAYGIIGAINPSFAFLQPVGKNVPHRRLKGFAMGVVSGLPGGFLIADVIIRGKEAVIKPGDVFLAEFKEEFTGEAATSASLMPGASSKVKGEVMDKK